MPNNLECAFNAMSQMQSVWMGICAEYMREVERLKAEVAERTAERDMVMLALKWQGDPQGASVATGGEGGEGGR